MTRADAIELLSSTVCRCGRDKARQTVFCRDCFYRLPVPIRRALYLKLGKGFEQAYQLAKKTLEEMEAKL